MAGLTVLLETHHRSMARGENGSGQQILVKPSMLLRRCSITGTSASQPPALSPSSKIYNASFLESCYLCRKHLSHDKDIYIYRGDRAFCSMECRNRHMINDQKTLSRRRKGRMRAATATGGFAY